jgi:hypothetical protein
MNVSNEEDLNPYLPFLNSSSKVQKGEHSTMNIYAKRLKSGGFTHTNFFKLKIN